MRRCWMALLPVFTQAGCIRTEPPSLSRAARYLWSQQADDGGWHSHTYGLLRSGQSLTPFVLEALLQVPEAVYPLPAAKVDRAIAFIQSNTQTSGALGMQAPGIPDYPNHAPPLQARVHHCPLRSPTQTTPARRPRAPGFGKPAPPMAFLPFWRPGSRLAIHASAPRNAG